jgi:hypothetical protein
MLRYHMGQYRGLHRDIIEKTGKLFNLHPSLEDI